MAKEMIISSNGFERKIAILEDGILTEYYVERAGEVEGIVGNIYKGRVTRVLPGMQSAFVDIGLERDAFLYVSDVFDFEDLETEYEAAAPAVASAAPSAAQPESLEQEGIDVEEIFEAIAEAKASRQVRRQVGEAAESERLEEVTEVESEVSGGVAACESSWPEEEEKEVLLGANAVPDVDLKEAIVHEKLIEAIQAEEMGIESAEESRPQAELGSRIGSLRRPLTSSLKRQRIIDVEPEAEAGEEVGHTDVRAESEAPEGSEREVDSTRPLSPAPESSESSTAVGEAPSAVGADRPSADGEAKGEASGLEEPPLADAEASVRQPRARAEFVNRRRTRRRRPSHAEKSEAGADEARSESKLQPTITELLQEGQEILVQIAKEPIGTKGARVTNHIALPGRYLVYMPTSEHIGVSRRISSVSERARLRRLITELKARHSVVGGFIVRTAADGCAEGELLDDLQYLLHTWGEIRHRAEREKAPKLIHSDVDLVERILRDRLSGDFTSIRVDDEDDYARIVDFVARFQPKLLNRVKLHLRDTPIFEEYGILAEIEKSIRPRVWLKSGGYIVINQTEALVAIDVNTGKFVGKTSRFEDTITKTNMEAAKEIARQIRLRDLGGIIVLDFIDMEERKNRQKVMQLLEEELKKDRAPTKILQFNDFGLVAITRKRVKRSLERTLCEPCPYCRGSGMVKSPQTVCLEILDEAKRMRMAREVKDGKEAILRLHPEVAKALREQYTRLLEEIETYLGGSLTIKTDPLIHQEQFDIAVM